jgi:hypothetical protein
MTDRMTFPFFGQGKFLFIITIKGCLFIFCLQNGHLKQLYLSLHFIHIRLPLQHFKILIVVNEL